VEVYFAPQDRVVDSVTAQARRANREILFAIFSFTYPALGEALIWGAQQGFRVAGVIDKSGANDPASQYPRLRNQSIPILIDSVPFGNGVLHEKIMVIDCRTVIAGSANWSNNANFNNDENILIIYHPEVAKRFYPELIERYVEAGGTYPPGIAEQSVEIEPVPRVRYSRFFRPEPDEQVYDAAGRKIVSGILNETGIYFVRDIQGKNCRLVLVR
jgi:phosphatidylserine/phosphatidylglycerophosphate/cardiolipin synthase-like enzyme